MTTIPPHRRHGRVVVVGDLVTDVHATLDGPVATGSDASARIRLTAGGSAANTAAWLATIGVPVNLVAAVGDDTAGADRVAELAALGVHCAVRRCADAATGTVVVLTDGQERSMLCDRGANTLLAPSDVTAALRAAPDATHLHLSGYTLFDEHSRPAGQEALAAARAARWTVSVDAASAHPLVRCGAAMFLDWVRDVDVLLANVDEARALAGSVAPATTDPVEMATRLAARVGLAVVKLGERGAVAASAAEPAVRVPATRAVAVDPTGAGDAFAAGFLAGWLSGDTIAGAVTAGVHLGARAVAAPGARPLSRPSR